jgi:isopentenyl diphosphate isomerase/L-lactate dehydrogenase-like FMN-dependent dehydrogenase
VAASGLAAYVASLFDAPLTWKDLEWLVGLTKLPVLVKGILRSDDALRAVHHGASGIIVSNTGARQLDTTPGDPIEVLPEIRGGGGIALPSGRCSCRCTTCRYETDL